MTTPARPCLASVARTPAEPTRICAEPIDPRAALDRCASHMACLECDHPTGHHYRGCPKGE